MKIRIQSLIWLVVAIAAVCFLAYQTPRESLFKTLSQISWPWVIAAVLLQLTVYALYAFRWVLLLKANGIALAWDSAVGLTFLGLFYNNVMPGGVGGDLLKGWYATRHSTETKRLAAAVSVFVDRVIGLAGMILAGNVAALFVESRISYKGFQLRWLPVIMLMMVFLPISYYYFSQRRHLQWLIRLLKKVPFKDLLVKIDGAIRFYRHHGVTVVCTLFLTLLLQGLGVFALWLLTQSLHLESVRFLHCLMVMPLIALAGAAIPVPGGMGIIEGSMIYLYCVIINPDHLENALPQAAALAILNRIFLLYLCSTPGLFVPLLGGHLPINNNALSTPLSPEEARFLS